MINRKDFAIKPEDLTNFGSALADLLMEAGIRTTDALFGNGIFQTFINIKAQDTKSCFSNSMCN
jgi:hypothetical protein